MITIETINRKLGLDIRTWTSGLNNDIEDDRSYDNPFLKLTAEELDFLEEYFNKN